MHRHRPEAGPGTDPGHEAGPRSFPRRAEQGLPAEPDAAMVGRLGSDTVVRLQRAAGNTAVAGLLEPEASAPGAVDEGRPLPGELRAKLEPAFGADFSSVRVHAGGDAAASAAALGARAYTIGEDIVVGERGSDEQTLAHELAHVVQQRQGSVEGTTRADGLSVSDPGDRFELAADAAAERATGARDGDPGAALDTAGAVRADASAPGGAYPAAGTAQRAPKDDKEIPTVNVEDLPSSIPTVNVEDLPKSGSGQTTSNDTGVTSAPTTSTLPDTTISVSNEQHSAWLRGEFDGYLGAKNDPIGTVGFKNALDYQAGYEEGQGERSRGEKVANITLPAPKSDTKSDDRAESFYNQYGSIGPGKPRKEGETETEPPERFDEEAPYRDREALEEMFETGPILLGD